jgi:hypothetical protein
VENPSFRARLINHIAGIVSFSKMPNQPAPRQRP